MRSTVLTISILFLAIFLIIKLGWGKDGSLVLDLDIKAEIQKAKEEMLIEELFETVLKSKKDDTQIKSRSERSDEEVGKGKEENKSTPSTKVKKSKNVEVRKERKKSDKDSKEKERGKKDATHSNARPNKGYKEDGTLNVKGKFLVASPELDFPNFFQRTVILMVEYSNVNGSMGFVINKQTPEESGVEKFSLMYENQKYYAVEEARVGIGGPVALDKGHFFHDDGTLEDSIKVVEGVYFGGNSEELIKRLIGLSNYKPKLNMNLLFGHSGWMPLQLESEYDRGSWVICEANKRYLWDIQPSEIFNVLKKECWDLKLAYEMQSSDEITIETGPITKNENHQDL